MTQHTLMSLPYGDLALSPDITQETISYHYDKHHRTYLNNLNNLLESCDDKMKSMSLKELVIYANGKQEYLSIFNNAAQVLNHDFYWLSMKPNGGVIDGVLAQKILAQWNSINEFKDEFIKIGLSQFGSGWVWLVQDNISHKLEIMKTSNADNPLLHNKMPLITCDVWEHAYYIDYRNKRADYIQTFLNSLVNWEFAEQNLLK